MQNILLDNLHYENFVVTITEQFLSKVNCSQTASILQQDSMFTKASRSVHKENNTSQHNN